MTFAELKARIKSHLGLGQPESDTRIGHSINQHYRRITSLLGLTATRFVTRSASTTNGVRTVVFSSIEKIDRLIDATDSDAIRLLTETSVHEIRSSQPGTGQPTRWALQNTDNDSVTVILDVLPQSTYSLQADGTTSLADLAGTDSPAFPESFHDILAWFVIAEEYLRKEKLNLAKEYQARAEQLLSDLRFHLADSPTYSTKQGGGTVTGSGGSGGGGGSVGGTAYTQSALITFDRDPAAPFAVTSGSAKVDNLDADLLDGLSAADYAQIAGTNVFTGANTFPNSGGLRILDTNGTHTLWITPTSDLTSNRLLNLATGDSDRTITLSGNPTLADWFDQSVKVAASPTFASPTLTGSLTMTAGDDILIENHAADDINAFRVRQSVANKSAAIRVENTDNTASGRVISGLYTAVPDGAGDTYRGSIHNYGSNYNVAAFRGYTNVSCDRGEGLLLRSVHATTANVKVFVGSTGGFSDEVAQFTPSGFTLSVGVLNVSAFGSHLLSAGGTGNQQLTIRNTTAGTGNGAMLTLGNDAAAAVCELRATASTYTAAGTVPQDGVNLNVTRAGGLNLSAEHATGVIRFFAGGSTERMQITAAGNVGIGTSTFGTDAAKVLALVNGTAPTTSPADTVQLFSADISAGNASLGIRTETAVVTESVTSDRTLSVTINGTVYKICLKA